MIFTGSEDGIVYVYDLLSAQIIKKLKSHSRAVVSIDLSPNRNSFVSAS